MDKVKVPQWILNIIFTMLIILVGVVFKNVIIRIENVEARSESNYSLFIEINRSLGQIEGFIKALTN